MTMSDPQMPADPTRRSQRENDPTYGEPVAGESRPAAEPVRDEPLRSEPVMGESRRDQHVADDTRGGDHADHRAPVAAVPVDSRDPREAGVDTGSVRADRSRTTRQEVVAREKSEFGGFKFGSAFFGWLTATGTTVILTALVAGAGAALGLGSVESTDEAAEVAEQNADTIGLVGIIAVLVILLIAYYCGGYVAGRMARFSGAKQGVAVWLWAVVIAVVVAIIGVLAGAQFNVLENLNSFPRLPIGEGELTTAGVLTAVGALVISLVGAVLGGLGGMRYHRKVDKAGLGQ
jgi:uncharacterized membrane protein